MKTLSFEQLRRIIAASAIVAAGTLAGGCKSAQVGSAPATTGEALDPEVRADLPELAKGHSDKIQLAWYATSLLRRLDPPVKDFANDMSAEHTRLLKTLEMWASAHHVDITFHPAPNLIGSARKAMESDQGEALAGTNNDQFQRTMLMLMYTDYQWQRHLIAAMIPRAGDPALKAYLQESLQVHEKHLKEISALLDRYKWQ